MEQNLALIHQILEKLVGLHRQMLDVVRLEKEAIISANLNGVQEATYRKEALIEAIRAQETLRLEQTAQLSIMLRKPARDLTIQNLIILIQVRDAKRAEQLRSAFNALTMLITRIREQSAYNLQLIQDSLKNIDEMKTNVLGEAVPRSDTYGNQGQRVTNTGGARLISKEA